MAKRPRCPVVKLVNPSTAAAKSFIANFNCLMSTARKIPFKRNDGFIDKFNPQTSITTVFLLIAHDGVSQHHIWEEFISKNKSFGLVIWVSDEYINLQNEFIKMHNVSLNISEWNKYGDLIPTILVLMSLAIIRYPNLTHCHLVPGNSVPIKHLKWYNDQSTKVCFDPVNWNKLNRPRIISYSMHFSISRFLKIL
jgi:hypothetical protein